MVMVKVNKAEFEGRQFGPVTFSLGEGEIVLLCGLSGSGKSTLCQLLCRRREPTGGVIETASEAAIGYIAHDFENQLLGATVGDELGLGEERFPESPEVVGALEVFSGELEGKLAFDPHEISKADQQIVLLYSLIRAGCRLLVLDESLAYLDPVQWMRFLRVVERLKDTGVSTLLVSHQSQCLEHVDRVLALEQGKLAFDGSAGDFDRRGQRSVGFEEPPISQDHGQVFSRLEVGPELSLRCLDGSAVLFGPGQILMVGGMAGSGKTAALESLFGLRESKHWSFEQTGLSRCFLRQAVAPSFWRRRVSEEWQASLSCFRSLPKCLEQLLWMSVPKTWWDRGPHQLSHGQLRYFGVICLMAQFPCLLFLDQPFLGLDGTLRARLLHCLEAFQRTGGRAILSTNNTDMVDRLAHTVIWLEDSVPVFLGQASSEEWKAFSTTVQGWHKAARLV
jgi:energy-coupling factor transporter ATP-binding protein EcfA2